MGAPKESQAGGPASAGRAYIFDGATRALLRELKAPVQTVNRFFGDSVAGIEDVNGDGRGDVIIGTASAAGYVGYVFDGATGTRLYQLAYAREFASVPDVNGDGRPDIVTDESDRSAIRLFNGATGQPLRSIVNPNPGVNNAFGFSLSGIPDVNGDGRGEVIASAPVALAEAGRVYVFDGATGAVLYRLTSPDEQERGNFGLKVVGVPDLNGDGRWDFAAIQRRVGGFPGVSGRIYTYDGATGRLLRSTELVPPTIGETDNYFDFLSVVPDVTGDRLAELLVYGKNNGEPMYYLFDGASSALIGTLPYYFEPYISPVSGMPDVNGDGRGEVLISATYASQVYLYLSDGPPLPPKPRAAGFVNEGFLVRLKGEPAITYELQASDDLVNWTILKKQTQANPVMEFLDVEAKNKSWRFYRTRTAQ